MLANRDLFRELADMNETFDRFFNQVWGSRGFINGPRAIAAGLPLDIAETEEGYVVKASLPGINPDDLDITYSDNVLTIKGEVKQDETVERSKYHLQERWYGQFQRSVTLPARVLADQIEAKYEHGVLSLFLPKSEEARPKRIAVHAGSQQKMIEGHLTDKN